MADQIAKPSNPADDWKIWLVLNPADTIIPIFIALTVLGIAVHAVVYARGLAYVIG